MSIVADKALKDRITTIMGDKDKVFFAPLEMAPKIFSKKGEKKPKTPAVFIEKQSVEYVPNLGTLTRMGSGHGFYAIYEDTATDELLYVYVQALAKRVDYKLTVLADNLINKDQTLNYIGFSLITNVVQVEDLKAYTLYPIVSNFEDASELQQESLGYPLHSGSFSFSTYVWVFQMSPAHPPVKTVSVNYKIGSQSAFYNKNTEKTYPDWESYTQYTSSITDVYDYELAERSSDFTSYGVTKGT